MSGLALIGYDGSPAARHAIAQAARVLGPRPAIVLFVWDPIAPGLPGGDPFGLTVPVIDPEQVDAVNRSVRENAETVAADGARLASEAGFDAEPLAVELGGSSWATIIGVAAEREADVIVVGARGHSKIRSMLLGSVSNGVVHHARMPVLVLPAKRDGPAPEDAES